MLFWITIHCSYRQPKQKPHYGRKASEPVEHMAQWFSIMDNRPPDPLELIAPPERLHDPGPNEQSAALIYVLMPGSVCCVFVLADAQRKVHPCQHSAEGEGEASEGERAGDPKVLPKPQPLVPTQTWKVGLNPQLHEEEPNGQTSECCRRRASQSGGRGMCRFCPFQPSDGQNQAVPQSTIRLLDKHVHEC